MSNSSEPGGSVGVQEHYPESPSKMSLPPNGSIVAGRSTTSFSGAPARPQGRLWERRSSLSGRRRRSISKLTHMMTTVQEALIDSRTLPSAMHDALGLTFHQLPFQDCFHSSDSHRASFSVIRAQVPCWEPAGGTAPTAITSLLE